MISPPARSRKEATASLRHHLRTALNHILGYAEMLLEENSDLDVASTAELESIRDTAKRIQQSLTVHMPTGDAVPDTGLQQLRHQLAEPVAAVIRSVGSLTQALPPTHLMDLLRINVAAGELLAFAEGDLKVDSPHASLPRRDAKRPIAEPGSILVVDDNEGNRDMLSRQLRRQGHEVDIAEDGPHALQQMARKRFDVVLLDVLMPGMDGLAVLDAVKADANTQGVAVVMISAVDELDHVARCLEAGAEDYLMKPFEATLLQARIASSLDRKRLRDRELERSRELERANEELQQFAYIASHDLKEPLRTMAVYAQLLMRRWGGRDDKDSEQFLQFIVEGARRMQTLIESVLALSRAGRSGRVPADPVNVALVIQGILTDLRATIADSGATVTFDELPVVRGDDDQLTQLFLNLIGNAVKYRRPDVPPQVHISARCQDGTWLFEVADNGLGIAPEYAEEVFLPFKRLHGREIPGSGIGLALCRRIVEQHGGRIWVEPRADGGSRFRFTLGLEPCV